MESETYRRRAPGSTIKAHGAGTYSTGRRWRSRSDDVDEGRTALGRLRGVSRCRGDWSVAGNGADSKRTYAELVIAIKQLNRDGNQGNKEFLVVVLMGLRRRAQSRRYGRRCLASVLGRELTAEYEIADPSRRDGRVPPADEIAARPRAEENGVNVGKNGRS